MSQQYTNYASHNVFTFTGRVMDVHLIDGQYGESLSVTMITTLVTDGDELTVQFTNKNGLMTMFKNGKLDKGRMLTVTGRLRKVEQVYTDKADGATKLLTRPRITLEAATVFGGGLGPAPKREAKSSAPAAGTVVMTTTNGSAAPAPAVDPTPAFAGEPSSEEIPF